jgi:predicted  nucleic acid-binding Zn-ribbon protein
MSFATPEMTGTYELPQSTGLHITPCVDSQKTFAQVQGVRFPLLQTRLPMHTNLQHSLAPCTGVPKTTALDANHGIEIKSYQTDNESAPVTMRFNNSRELAQMLFPTSANSNVNIDHMHDGLMNHTDAINSLVSLTQKSSSDASAKYKTLSSSLDVGHKTFHTALAHHTDVLQHLEDHRSQQDEGIRNHKEHIEMSLASLQQQNMELETQARQLKEQHSTLSSFKTILQSQYDVNTKGLADVHKRFETHAREQGVHATALQNHMEVIQSHVGILNAQDADIGLHSEALINHRDALRGNAKDISSHSRRMESLSSNFQSVDAGLIHHTEEISKVHARQNKSDNEMKFMAEQQTHIMETQSNINRNISNLESYISQNNEKIDMLTKKNTGADMKQEILRIKTAVNENATVLQTLFQNIHKRNP